MEGKHPGQRTDQWSIPEIVKVEDNYVLGRKLSFTLFTMSADLLTKLSDETKKLMGKEIQEVIDRYAKGHTCYLCEKSKINGTFKEVPDPRLPSRVWVCEDCR